MGEPFLGEVRLFSFDFAPRGWLSCSGQTLPINQNQALFSLLGTTYGGNGTSTFVLPDLRSKVVVGAGNGIGLTPRIIGEVGGQETHTLLLTEMPAHTHTVHCSSVIDNSGSGSAPTGNFWTRENDGDAPYGSAGGLVAMHPSAVAQNTGGQPHSNIQPYLVVNFCIAAQGIFPSRN